MGKRFGELGVHIRGIVYYIVSQHELKPFANVIRKGPSNVVTRTRDTVWRWLIPLGISYVIYRYCEWANWASHRKNPKDYAHEKPPPPPRMCFRVQEPKPHCKVDWVYETYECEKDEKEDLELMVKFKEQQERLGIVEEVEE